MAHHNKSCVAQCFEPNQTSPTTQFAFISSNLQVLPVSIISLAASIASNIIIL